MDTVQQTMLENSEQTARLRAEQTVHALSTQVEAKLLKIHFFVEHLTEHWLDHDLQIFKKLIGMGQKSIFKNDLDFVLVTDKNGNIVFSSTPVPMQKDNLEKREYFQRHVEGYEDFTISKPLKNTINGHWTLQFSHSYHIDGEFAGVVIAAVHADHFSKQFTTIFPDPDDVVLLLANDGTYLTRSRNLEQHLGKKVPQEREFITDPAQNSGTYNVQAPIDGIQRYYAWHRLEDYNLVLSLGLGKDKILAPTVTEIKKSRGQSQIASLLLMIAALWITRLAYFRAQQSNKLLRTQERLSTLLNRIPSAVLLVDENNRIVAINPNFCHLFQLQRKPEHLYGMHHRELMQLMDSRYAKLFALPDKHNQANLHTETNDHNGRTLNIDWVVIWRKQRFLGHGWFIEDITPRKLKETELINMATTDFLTGLANRRSFISTVDKHLQNIDAQQPGAMLLLDIDHFKKVNDTYGHPAGDQVLRNVASLLQQSVRQSDLCGRLGGEEFAILLPHVKLEQALQLAERIRQQVEQQVTRVDGHAISITISIGVSQLHGSEMSSVHSRADAALYRAKQQGRNQTCH